MPSVSLLHHRTGSISSNPCTYRTKLKATKGGLKCCPDELTRAGGLLESSQLPGQGPRDHRQGKPSCWVGRQHDRR